LIKKTLVDQDSAGREALLINERDVIQYEKQQVVVSNKSKVMIP
jgi:hypothetical protein